MLLFGIIQITASLFELLRPYKSFNMWKRWIFNRLFPVHGVILILSGFPLIIYKGYLAQIIVWIGIVMAITGPFLIFYPEKIKSAVISAEKEFQPRDIRNMIYIDASIRLSAGLIVFTTFIKTAI